MAIKQEINKEKQGRDRKKEQKERMKSDLAKKQRHK